MERSSTGHLSISDLTERTGLTRRTIRYYIQRGLVDQPNGVKRGAWYTQRHLQQLLAIKYLQDGNLTLEEIGRRVRQAQDEPAGQVLARQAIAFADMEVVTPPRAGETVKVAEGIDLVVDASLSELGPAELRRFVSEIRRLYRQLKRESSR